MPLKVRRPPDEAPTRPDGWAQQPLPAPESRPHYYVRQGLWRLRGVRRTAPWLLLLVPVAAIAVAALAGKSVWHSAFPRRHTSAEVRQRGKLKPHSSSRAAAGGGAGSSAGSSSLGTAGSSSAPGSAQNASVASSPLAARIRSLRAQLAALLRGGVTPAERAKLWRLRLQLALAYRDLIRAELAGNLTAAQRARLDAQLAKLDRRVGILKKINRLLRGGLTATEQAKFDSLVQQFLKVQVHAPLPALASLTTAVRVTAGASTPATTTAAAVPRTTPTPTPPAPVDATPVTPPSSSPGNSAFGHSHKKPKKKAG